jgi:hypothetical protein
MPDIDPEIVERAVRWCAESGRPAREEDVRAALSPLGWDELLAVKAVLADPPPARDLGPPDLVRLSRGSPPPHGAASVPDAPEATPSPRGPARGRSRPSRAPAGPRIRRARDRAEELPAAPSRLPLVDELFRESGRAELDRRIRRLGASRAAILSDLARGWGRPDGSAPDAADLERLLDHHGLSRGFAERERALVLHVVRKHAGVLCRAAAALGIDAEGLRAAVRRLGVERQAEAIRAERRRSLERKGTLSERARLLDEEEEALADLGMRDAWVEDLKRRLPVHLRALSAGGRPPSAIDLGRSLALSRGAVDRLAERFALRLRSAPAGLGAGRPPGRSPGRPPPRTAAAARPASRSGSRPDSRPAGDRRPRPRSPEGRAPSAGSGRGRGTRRPV